jgi:hypothetical protein
VLITRRNIRDKPYRLLLVHSDHERPFT